MAATSPLYKTLSEPRMRGMLYTKKKLCVQEISIVYLQNGPYPTAIKIDGSFAIAFNGISSSI